MKLNHLDLHVSDVPRTVEIFERYFGLELQTSRTSPAIAILGDGHGFVLVLQRRKPGGAPYPEGFHLGFLVDDVEAVRSFHARAREGGLDVSDIDVNNRGTMVYLAMPDGFAIEVSCRRPHPR